MAHFTSTRKRKPIAESPVEVSYQGSARNSFINLRIQAAREDGSTEAFYIRLDYNEMRELIETAQMYMQKYPLPEAL